MEESQEQSSLLQSKGLVDAVIEMRAEPASAAGDGAGVTSREPDREARAPFRWDNVFTAYMVSISLTAIQIAGSPYSEYNRPIVMMAYIHFAFETTQSWHFIYSGKAASYLSAVTMIVCFVLAIAVWFYFDAMKLMFLLAAIGSDSFSFIAAVCLLFNKAIPERMRLMPCAVMPHFIGVSLKLYYIPTEFYVADRSTLRHHGALWVMMSVASLVQIWLCRDVIRGGVNHCGRVRYDDSVNSKFFILFSKFGAPFVGILVIPAIVFVLAYFRTIEEFSDEFASWIWDDVIHVVMWPVGMSGLLWTVYLRATPLKSQ